MSTPRFKASFRVEYVDTDATRTVYYGNYFRYFERAEEEFYRSLGFSFAGFRERGLWLARVEAFCQYKKPARYDDLLEVEVSVEELKEKAIKLGFRVSHKEGGDLLAFGHLVTVVADMRTDKARRVPADISEKLKPFAKMVL
jgi:acyl-CoA thioester hydrolase